MIMGLLNCRAATTSIENHWMTYTTRTLKKKTYLYRHGGEIERQYSEESLHCNLGNYQFSNNQCLAATNVGGHYPFEQFSDSIFDLSFKTTILWVRKEEGVNHPLTIKNILYPN